MRILTTKGKPTPDTQAYSIAQVLILAIIVNDAAVFILFYWTV
jgi:hypothetical protein